jgi:hypothetical protein
MWSLETNGLVWITMNRQRGAAVGQLVEAMRYKPAGRGFDGVSGFFHWHNPVGRTMALGSTLPLTEMSTRNISLWGGGGVNAAGAYGWQPTTFICRLSRNLGASTSWNPVGLSRPVMGLLLPTRKLRQDIKWCFCKKKRKIFLYWFHRAFSLYK